MALRPPWDAFPYKRSTLYLWEKQLGARRKKIEALNKKSTAPRKKRRRLWSAEIISEIRRLRQSDIHPNLGPEKTHPLLKEFCATQSLRCPEIRTIACIIADDPKKMQVFPKKVSHYGKVKKANRKKVLRKPKDFKVLSPGYLVALDTVERFIHGCRRYVITF